MMKSTMRLFTVWLILGSLAAAENFPHLTQKAENGDVDAQYELGLRYLTGRGKSQNFKFAAAWFGKAAQNGHAEAQKNLAIMYENGQGVLQSDKSAAVWYQRAALQGNGFAQYCLGKMYASGRGVQEDVVQALKWFLVAAATTGNPSARQKAVRLAAEMTPAQAAEGRQLAHAFKPEIQ